MQCLPVHWIFRGWKTVRFERANDLFQESRRVERLQADGGISRFCGITCRYSFLINACAIRAACEFELRVACRRRGWHHRWNAAVGVTSTLSHRDVDAGSLWNSDVSEIGRRTNRLNQLTLHADATASGRCRRH